MPLIWNQNIWMQLTSNMLRHSVMCRDGRVPRESEGERFITVYMCLFALHWPEPDLKSSLSCHVMITHHIQITACTVMKGNRWTCVLWMGQNQNNTLFKVRQEQNPSMLMLRKRLCCFCRLWGSDCVFVGRPWRAYLMSALLWEHLGSDSRWKKTRRFVGVIQNNTDLPENRLSLARLDTSLCVH